MKARELAQGKWPGVLAQLGVPADCLTGKHGPCPKTGEGTDRFRFADRDGSGNYFCDCSDGTRGGLGLLMCVHGWDYPRACKEVERIVGGVKPSTVAAQPSGDPRRSLRTVQAKLQPIGDAVRDYLATRGLAPPPRGVGQARLRYFEDGKPVGDYDAMVARVVAPDGKPLTFHVTYLDGGVKAKVPAPRKLMTPAAPVNGGCVRLFPDAEEIGVAEGIETALAVYALFGIPCWAAINAELMAAWEPPAGTRKVTVFGDNDPNFHGHAAAYKLAHRLAKKGIECGVGIPSVVGWDWNDVLLSEQPVAASVARAAWVGTDPLIEQRLAA